MLMNFIVPGSVDSNNDGDYGIVKTTFDIINKTYITEKEGNAVQLQ